MVYKTCNLIQASLYDRVKKLLVSYEWSDCSFSVAGKVFKAHKLILGISSPVFEAMFYGPLSTDTNVVITDIESDIFQLMLNYIYTDKVELSSVEEAFELLYVSKKYILEHLSELCIKYIQENITVDNVIEVLNYPDYLQDKKLISISLKLFCEHAKYLLQENKDLISQPCMKAILGSNEMNIEEKDLIKHVFEWTSYCCETNGTPSTFENRRKILLANDLLKLFRPHTLSLEELDKLSKDENNLWLPSEIEKIRNDIMRTNLCYVHTCNLKEALAMTPKARHPMKLQWYLCRRSPLRPVAPIVIDTHNCVVYTRIKANKTVFVNSFNIPTRNTPPSHYRTNAPRLYTEQLTVNVICESDNSVIHFSYLGTVEFDTTTDLQLPEACMLKKDQWYKISIVWPRHRIYKHTYGVELRERLYMGHKINFEFDDICTSNGNYGSFLGGLKFCL